MKRVQLRRVWFQMVLAVGLGVAFAALAGAENAPAGDSGSNAEVRAARRMAPNERKGEQMGERLIDHLLANARLTTEIGLTEDTVARLREESHALQARQIDLDAQIRKLSLSQADRMSKLLLSADVNTNEVMKSVEEIGRLRTEQAKLAVQHLLVVRQYLTPDQIRKARELMRERMQNNADGRPAKRDKNAPAAAGTPPEGL